MFFCITIISFPRRPCHLPCSLVAPILRQRHGRSVVGKRKRDIHRRAARQRFRGDTHGIGRCRKILFLTPFAAFSIHIIEKSRQHRPHVTRRGIVADRLLVSHPQQRVAACPYRVYFCNCLSCPRSHSAAPFSTLFYATRRKKRKRRPKTSSSILCLLKFALVTCAFLAPSAYQSTSRRPSSAW